MDPTAIPSIMPTRRPVGQFENSFLLGAELGVGNRAVADVAPDDLGVMGVKGRDAVPPLGGGEG